MKTIKREELNPITMSVKKNQPCTVISNNFVYEYVGIGWIQLRKVTTKDLKTFPTVID